MCADGHAYKGKTPALAGFLRQKCPKRFASAGVLHSCLDGSAISGCYSFPANKRLGACAAEKFLNF
jgi:hypothetical protein